MTQSRRAQRWAVERALEGYARQLHALIDELEAARTRAEQRRVVERICALTAVVAAAAEGLGRRN